MSQKSRAVEYLKHWNSAPHIVDVGEKAILSTIAKIIGNPDPPVTIGVGDDAAVIDIPAMFLPQLRVHETDGSEEDSDDISHAAFSSSASLVVSTDTAVEYQHFRKEWISPYDVGRRAIVQNTGDIAAMGARIVAVTVAISVPRTTSVTAVLDIVRGAHYQASLWGAQIIGGDLVSADVVSITVTALGALFRKPLLLSSARIGDVVAVSSKVGSCAAGLAILNANNDHDVFSHYVDKFRVPSGPVDSEGNLVGPELKAHAITDISDGLVLELQLIAQKSGVRIIIDPGAIPHEPDLVDLAQILDISHYTWLLNGGEDHVLVGTFAPNNLPKSWYPIGNVSSGEVGVTVRGFDGTSFTGWDSFRSMS